MKKSLALVFMAALIPYAVSYLNFHKTSLAIALSEKQMVLPLETRTILRLEPSSPYAESSKSEVQARDQNPTESLLMKGAEELPQSEQASLWTAFSEALRVIRPATDHQRALPKNEGAEYLASNPGQKILARFLPNGVRLLSGYSNRDWEGVISLDSDVPAEIRQEGTRLEYVRPDIVEWYHNKRDGIEHGFVVKHKTTKLTNPENGCLVVGLKVGGLTATELVQQGSFSSDLQFVNVTGEPVLSYTNLKVWDATGAMLMARMEPTAEGLRILVDDSKAQYPLTIDPLIASLEYKLGPEVLGAGAKDDLLGYSVSVSGNTALIGAKADDYDSGTAEGSAYMFVRNDFTWSLQQKLTAGDAAAGGNGNMGNINFGFSVCVDGDIALIGAKADDAFGVDSGSAYVFVRNGSTWSQQQKITASDAAAGDNFGYSVSVSGDTALIGSPYDDITASQSGSAYVFVRSGSTWSQQQKLHAAGYNYGFSVSVSGDTALIRAGGIDSGSAHVFVRSGSTWSLQQKITPSDAAVGEYLFFGYSVSVDGDTAIIGAMHDDDDGTDSGSAYVFVRSGSRWSQQQKITAIDAAAGDNFGYSVSVNGNTALIGSPSDDNDGRRSGSAYVFVRNGSTWSQQQKLTAGDATVGDYFGSSVSVSGDTALIGAPYDDADGYNSGSAYVFVRNGSTWSQQQKLTAGDDATGDSFGYSVSVDGNTALIGAPHDGTNSGSAYVFVRSGSTWSLQQKLTAGDGAAGDNFGSSVSVSGNTALIGSPYDDDDGSQSGSAYVFVSSGPTWSLQQKITGDWSVDSSDFFGYSVSVDGDTALIGMYGDDDNGRRDTGSAFVFVRSGSTWSQQEKLSASNAAAGDYFGYSVSVSGNTALIGAYGKDITGSSNGLAYVFVRSGSTWQQRTLTRNVGDGASGERFGYSVSIDGDTALVGAPYDDDDGSNSGSAYVFVRSGSTWSLPQKLTAGDGAAGDNFGYSVSVSGGTALIGSPYDDDRGSQSGSSYVFALSGSTWSHQQKLTASDGTAGDNFGSSVSVSGNTALIGASLSDGIDLLGIDAPDQGLVYVFRLSNIGPDTDGDGASDVWETANGFNPNLSGDFLTLDTDQDGDLDVLEIFQGTDKDTAAERYGLKTESADGEGQNLTVSYRRSTASTGVVASYNWSTNLTDWYVGAQDAGGIKVDFTELVVSSGPGYEIVEVTATIVLGTAEQLFMRLRLMPFE